MTDVVQHFPTDDVELMADCRWLDVMGVVIREDDASEHIPGARSLALIKGDEILIACIIQKPYLDQLKELIGVYKQCIFQPNETRH